MRAIAWTNVETIAFLLDQFYLEARFDLANDDIWTGVRCKRLVRSFCLLVGMRRVWMQCLADVLDSLMYFLFRHLQFTGDLLRPAASKPVQVAINQYVCQGMGHFLLAERPQLDQQAFAQIPRSNAQWFQCLQLAQYVFNALDWHHQMLSDLLHAYLQVAAFIEIAYQLLCYGGIICRDKSFELLEQYFCQCLAHRNTCQGIELFVVLGLNRTIIIDVILARGKSWLCQLSGVPAGGADLTMRG